MALTKEELAQRKKLDERLKGRKLPPGWRDDLGVPDFPEDHAHGQSVSEGGK